MREKKRLEHVLDTDADLGRRSDDIHAYLDLAKEGENVDNDSAARACVSARSARQTRNRDAALG